MGTNYYWFEEPECDRCGRNEEPIHIGKSSAGWCFSLHVIPEKDIQTLEDWKKCFWKIGSYIEDEYGARHTTEEMLDIICVRSWAHPNNKDEKWYADNFAVPGPSGLARSRVGGGHCIGHGEGPWDYITGEFC